MTKKEIQAKKEKQLVLAYIQGKYDALLELELMSRNKSITKDVLNKIEAEIDDLADADAYGDYQMGFKFGLMKASAIIDKHKAEMEDKK